MNGIGMKNEAHHKRYIIEWNHAPIVVCRSAGVKWLVDLGARLLCLLWKEMKWNRRKWGHGDIVYALFNHFIILTSTGFLIANLLLLTEFPLFCDITSFKIGHGVSIQSTARNGKSEAFSMWQCCVEKRANAARI